MGCRCWLLLADDDCRRLVLVDVGNSWLLMVSVVVCVLILLADVGCGLDGRLGVGWLLALVVVAVIRWLLLLFWLLVVDGYSVWFVVVGCGW